jgi:CHAT domain-containing protein
MQELVQTRPWCLVARILSAVLASIAIGPHAAAAPSTCAEIIEQSNLIKEYHWTQHGTEAIHLNLPPTDGRDWLLDLAEHRVDVEVEVDDTGGHRIADADSPVERAGRRMVYLSGAAAGQWIATLTAKGSATTTGTVDVYLARVPAGGQPIPADGHTARSVTSSGPPLDQCVIAMRHWAAADEAYAAGRAIELGRTSPPPTKTAREHFSTAAREYQSAIDSLGHGSPRDTAELQLGMAALMYYELQRWSDSAEWASRGAHGFAEINEPYGQARALAIQAAWLERGMRDGGRQSSATPQEYQSRVDRSRAQLQRLVAFHARRHEDYEQTLQTNNIGLSYYYLGEYAAAIPYLMDAQRSFERLGETNREATALQNEALCEWGLGRLSRAIGLYDRAQTLIQPQPSPNLYLLLLNNSALAHYAAGQFDAALALEMEALDFATLSQSDRARARSYFGLGITYYAIGDRELATRFLQSALALCTADSDVRTRLAALRALAVIEQERGAFDDAIAHDTEALGIATGSPARARILIHLALDYAAAGERPRALELLRELLAHAIRSDRLVEGLVLGARGHVLHQEGRLQQASADLSRALPILERFDGLGERFETQVELAELRFEQHRESQALLEIRQALRRYDEIRAQTANPEYRSSIAQALRPALDLAITLMWSSYQRLSERGDWRGADRAAAEGLRLADDSRAKAFDDWRAERLDRAMDSHIASLLATRATLYKDMAERRFQLAAHEDGAGSDDARGAALRADIARIRIRAGLLDAQLAHEGPATASSFTPALLSQRPSGPSRPGGEPIYVEYWLGKPLAFAWVVAEGRLSWISLGPSADIDRVSRHLHEVMRSLAIGSASGDASDEGRRTAQDLYRLIISPLDLPESAPHAARSALIVFPDAGLHYVPFAALRESSASPYLVQRFDLAVGTALRHFGLAADEPLSVFDGNDQRMLLVADPIYARDDPRLPAGGIAAGHIPSAQAGELLAPAGLADKTKLERLTSTAREAAEVTTIYGRNQVDLLTGLDATRDAVLGRDLNVYRFVHIASHGLVDAQVLQLSALILGRYGRSGEIADPYIRTSDLLDKTFDAQAIVLSSCDSSLGKEFAAEGLIGLRYAALARGAHSVVASLWPVADEITAAVMTDMYRGIAHAPSVAANTGSRTSEPVVGGLSAAMRNALSAHPGLDPALWAPFTVYVAGR